MKRPRLRTNRRVSVVAEIVSSYEKRNSNTPLLPWVEISERDGKTGLLANPGERNPHPKNAGSAKEIQHLRGFLFRKCRQDKPLGILALPQLQD